MAAPGERYKKIVADTARLDDLLVDLLLQAVDQRLGLTQRLAGCFRDHRDHRRCEHSGNRAEPALETEPGSGAGAGPAGMRADGAGGTGVQGLPLPDAGQLEPRAARDRQGLQRLFGLALGYADVNDEVATVSWTLRCAVGAATLERAAP